MNRRQFLQTAAFAATPAPHRPNILLILIDDLGYGDPACFGGEIATPNIDRLARQGIRFTQAYVASPVCSPSRVGITTGQCPARQLIHNYLDTRQRQRQMGMRDFLDLKAPSLARTLQQSGYATGHFGKWHMGGGRDVGDAPPPTAYGFDESLTSFEGLGDRVLPPGRLSEMNEKLGNGKISHAPQRELTEIYVNRATEFIRQHAGKKPFYVQLWPNEVHDPFDPKPELMPKFERFSSNKYVQQYYATLDEMDRQIGRLMQQIDDLGLTEDTLIVFLSDNGPTAWPSYYKEGLAPPGSTAGLRGRKWSLYEGGIRTPLIAQWKGRIPAGQVDERTIFSALDFFPTFCKIAKVRPPQATFDGEDLSAAFLGKPTERRKPLFWEYGRDATYNRPGLKSDQSPNMAIRSHRWKFLMNEDGSDAQLYDFAESPKEQHNVAAEHQAVATGLKRRLVAWRKSLPVLNGKG